MVREPAKTLLRLLPDILAVRMGRGKDGVIALNHRDNKPLYEQVAERLRELMLKGVLPQDAQLPSVCSLVTELSINPSIIQRMYTELEHQGYIYSVKSKDSFVADNSRMKAGVVQEWKGCFKATVEESIKVGATAGEMKEMIDTVYRNHVMERGESND